MAPTSDVILKIRSSWSASSQNPGIQAGSGGVAYASGVSVTTALRSSAASAGNRRFIAPCIYASGAGKSTTRLVGIPEVGRCLPEILAGPPDGDLGSPCATGEREGGDASQGSAQNQHKAVESSPSVS